MNKQEWQNGRAIDFVLIKNVDHSIRIGSKTNKTCKIRGDESRMISAVEGSGLLYFIDPLGVLYYPSVV